MNYEPIYNKYRDLANKLNTVEYVFAFSRSPETSAKLDECIQFAKENGIDLDGLGIDAQRLEDLRALGKYSNLSDESYAAPRAEYQKKYFAPEASQAFHLLCKDPKRKLSQNLVKAETNVQPHTPTPKEVVVPQ